MITILALLNEILNCRIMGSNRDSSTPVSKLLGASYRLFVFVNPLFVDSLKAAVIVV